ncbi:GAF domain-containing sensor histidine kinase [Patescibacteria group bacterium]|nr:GAF domain-containing sensor histidine kinase [Patescibacteria group bacterium]
MDSNTEKTLERINKSALKLLEPLTPEKTYTVIVQEAKKLVKAKMGSIVLMVDGNLETIYASAPFLCGIKPRKKGFNYKVFKTQKAMTVAVNKVSKIHPAVKKHGIKSIVFIPLSYKKKSIGVLNVNSTEESHFTKKELSVLKLYGSLASLAIKKNQLYSQTKKALSVRDLFISMAAHELRTPLTSINGYIQLLCTRFCNTSTQESMWIKSLQEESQRLTNLVYELLEINHIQSGKLQYNFRDCNLSEVLKNAIKSFNIAYPERKILLNDTTGETQGLIIGDSEKLLQVIRNLLENAAKYSYPDKTIDVSLESSTSYVVLSIVDHGRGIPKKEIPLIFKGFYKGTNSGEEGMGLGLFLVRNIIYQHHGSIKILSSLDIGTKVEVKLPKVKYGYKK